MDDLDATRLCAEAMGIEVTLKPIRGTIMRWWFMDGNVERNYQPLHDDAQAMALVKRLGLWIEDTEDGWGRSYWRVTTNRIGGKWTYTDDKDLNRAIVMCVATMWQEYAHAR